MGANALALNDQTAISRANNPLTRPTTAERHKPSHHDDPNGASRLAASRRPVPGESSGLPVLGAPGVPAVALRGPGPGDVGGLGYLPWQALRSGPRCGVERLWMAPRVKPAERESRRQNDRLKWGTTT
jgi:hypothetical protein